MNLILQLKNVVKLIRRETIAVHITNITNNAVYAFFLGYTVICNYSLVYGT